MSRRSYMHPLLVSFIFSLPLSCYPCLGNQRTRKSWPHNIEGMFVFGSSVVDNGNNNKLNTTKVNYLPYGIDFPLGPTGRFTNGLTVADTIARVLRLPLPPSFADSRNKSNNIFHGVNFASGGSGILDATRPVTDETITLSEQIKNFVEVTLPKLQKLLGSKLVARIRGRYLFMIGAGNNDFTVNYFSQNNSTRPSLPVFVANLTATYTSHLQRLYNVGARKFVLLTVYPVGCAPVIKQVSKSQECVERVNAAAKYFNTQLITMVEEFKKRLPQSKFVVVNTYNIVLDITNNPYLTGFRNVRNACCELKEIQGIGAFCKEGGKVCNNRDSYVYFDGLHHTKAVGVVIANKAYFSNNNTEVYPFNLRKLVRL